MASKCVFCTHYDDETMVHCSMAYEGVHAGPARMQPCLVQLYDYGLVCRCLSVGAVRSARAVTAVPTGTTTKGSLAIRWRKRMRRPSALSSK